MSLKVNFSSLSLGAAVDQQTGNLSIFELVEEIRTPQVPLHLQQLVISLALGKTDADEFQGKILIHIITPDGKQQMLGTGDMQIPSEQRRMRAVFRFGGFPVFAYGQHRFVVSLMNAVGAKIGEALLDFEVIQAPQVAQGVPQGTPPGGKPPMMN
jgi:hypothetical protein